MKEILTNAERLNKVTKNLIIKKPSADDLRSLIIHSDFPNEEDNFAQIFQSYLTEECALIDDNDLDSWGAGDEWLWIGILLWLMSKCPDDLVYKIFDDYGKNFKVLYSWDKTNLDEDDSHFFESSFINHLKSNDHEILPFLKEEFRHVWFTDIRQITDELIILKKTGNDLDYLFDFEGNHLVHKLIECIRNSNNEICGPSIVINLGPDNLVFVQLGSYDWEEIGLYIVKWEKGQFEFIAEIEYDNFIEYKDFEEIASKNATDLTNEFFRNL